MIFGKLFLERVNSNFVRSSSDQFSEYLQANMELIPGEIKVISFAEYIKRLPFFTSINVFRTQPTQKFFIMEINQQVIFSFTDRLLGGKGSVSMKERQNFSFSEGVVLDKVTERFKQIYTDVFFDCTLVRRESQSRVIHTFLGTESVFVSDYQCYVNEQLVGGIHSCFPNAETI